RETATFAAIDYYEAKRRYWSEAERAEMQANERRAATVAYGVMDLQDLDQLTALQQQYRVVFGQDDKGLLFAMTDRARVAMSREHSDRVRDLWGRRDAMPTLDEARRMARWLEQEHGIRQAVTQGIDQSVSAQDQGQAFLETLGKHHLELQRDY